MKIAIISDNHVDRSADPSSWNLAKAAFRAAADADHVIIARDLFDCASAMRRDREEVRRFLRKLGLWHRDRLTVVVGGHDIFEIPHRGNVAQRLVRAARMLSAGAQGAYDDFCAWAADLVPVEDRHYADDLYPFRRYLDGITVVAADTSPATTIDAAEGRWSKGNDQAVRELLHGAKGARLLAIHNQPEASEARGLLDRLQGYVGGFPPKHFRRLERLADDVSLNAVVCGHVHDTCGAPWSWRLGQQTRVWMMGRTGGMHGAKPCIGVLDVRKRGRIQWNTERL